MTTSIWASKETELFADSITAHESNLQFWRTVASEADGRKNGISDLATLIRADANRQMDSWLERQPAIVQDLIMNAMKHVCYLQIAEWLIQQAENE